MAILNAHVVSFAGPVFIKYVWHGRRTQEGGFMEGEQLKDVTIHVDKAAIEDMERLKVYLHSPNLTTAVYNAVYLINQLYEYQNLGYELRLVKNGDVHHFRLPTKPPTKK